MLKKIHKILNKIYGITLSISFFAGILPIIPFVVAIIIGGETGEKISLFLYNDFYPWVIALASISIVIGLVAMYCAKQKALSVDEVSTKEKEDEVEA